MYKVIRCLICLLVTLTVCMAGFTAVMAEDKPDLEPVNIGVTVLYASVSNTVNVTVNKTGETIVTDFVVQLFANETLVNTVNANNSWNWWPMSVAFDWTPSAVGDYTLTAVVDPAGTVGESSETNNTLQKTVNVIALAPVTVKVRVEGKNSTIWSGQVTFQGSNITHVQETQTIDHPTAMGALDEASKTAGTFNYTLSSDYWPTIFVVAVAGELPQGWEYGWMYRVNWVSPDVGAADYSVKNGDEVLWCYGTWTAQPLRLTVSKNALTTAEKFTATVEAFNGMSWAPVNGATVNVGAQQHTTDAEGQVKNLSLPAGSYTVSASKGTWAEYVRSNKETVVVSSAPPAGDANGDGQINAQDITFVERIIAGLNVSTPGADANQDGVINALDITKIERAIAGLN